MKDKQFKKKVARARYVERHILKWIRKNFDKDAELVNGYFKEYDIISPKLGNVEIKEDRLAHKTNNYAIEYKCNGKPSGIDYTTAHIYILVDWDNVILIATESLKYLIRETKRKRAIEMGDRFNTGLRAEGWLIQREKILHSPLATVYKRWFKPIHESGFSAN